MPRLNTPKFGIGYGWALGENPGTQPLDEMRLIWDAAIKEDFSFDPINSNGLNYYYRGGSLIDQNGVVQTYSSGALNLTDNATNYVYRINGSLNIDLLSFPLNSVPLAVVVTTNGVITSHLDVRPSEITASQMLFLSTNPLIGNGTVGVAINSVATGLFDLLNGLPTTVQGYTLNLFAAPILPVNFNSQRLTNLGTPTASTDAATKGYIDAAVVGLLDDRGNYDASSNLFPATGGSGTAGAILKGDIWYISVQGALGGETVLIGDTVRALIDAPGQTAGNWDVLNHNIGFIPAQQDQTFYFGTTACAINQASGSHTVLAGMTSITSTLFTGSGAGLTDIPQSAVTDLTTDLGLKANAASPVFTITETLAAPNGGQWIKGYSTELITLSTVATFTDSTENLLPTDSILEAVEARIVSDITTATTWQLGDPVIAGRFTDANATLATGTTDHGTKHYDGTGTSGRRQATANKLRITTPEIPTGGTVRVTVFYSQFIAPTS